ncbi:MAG: NAD(P)(+) transhydrogenase (Re/Si-specific) subunit beta [Acidobacteriota bacterium]
MNPTLINLAYLIAAVLFIVGLKGLAHPRTAVRGNMIGALGMLLAIVVTLLDQHIVGYWVILAGLVVGSAFGVLLAVKIKMTAMPQMVALLNGFGGGASVLVAGAAYIEIIYQGGAAGRQLTISTAASGIIGAVTFWGSLVAFAKLQEIMPGKSILVPGQQVLNALLGGVSAGFGVWLVLAPSDVWTYWVLVAVASVLGVLVTIPVGGADMPVVIALLNSYSGLAAAATGFVLNNNVLIIAGSLVGASGIILSQIMCRAMNRSLGKVLMGMTESGGGPGEGEAIYEGRIKSTTAEELAMIFEAARRVVVVPGYGMAVAQAQHAVRDLMNLLEERGIEVEFAIHPVAGRMPGHMNVLLAEANVPYDKLKTMEEANPSFQQTDIAIVIGANDVVNPLAREASDSPIAGMPILNVDEARTVVVIKRSLSPGFAGVPNPLFARDNTLMYFNDGKKAVLDLVSALKEAG